MCRTATRAIKASALFGERATMQEEFMRSSMRIRMIAALVLPLAACATGKSSRMNSAKMCQAHGGTYDSTAQMCSHNDSQKSAKEICESMGGRYESNIQYCNDVAD
jgi:hypothetical protein